MFCIEIALLLKYHSYILFLRDCCLFCCRRIDFTLFCWLWITFTFHYQGIAFTLSLFCCLEITLHFVASRLLLYYLVGEKLVLMAFTLFCCQGIALLFYHLEIDQRLLFILFCLYCITLHFIVKILFLYFCYLEIALHFVTCRLLLHCSFFCSLEITTYVDYSSLYCILVAFKLFCYLATALHFVTWKLLFILWPTNILHYFVYWKLLVNCFVA